MSMNLDLPQPLQKRGVSEPFGGNNQLRLIIVNKTFALLTAFLKLISQNLFNDIDRNNKIIEIILASLFTKFLIPLSI
jgi:hypothetical protein